MKTLKIITISLVALFVIGPLTASALAGPTPLVSAFTYQGQVYDDNKVANGTYDFMFKLYSDPSAMIGAKVGPDINKDDVDVLDGNFTVQLDFGPGIFLGEARWLEIAVRPANQVPEESWTIMTPRQPLTPTPYAIHAQYSTYALNAPQTIYTGNSPIVIDNISHTIGLNAATNTGDLMTWDGTNWIAKQPATQGFTINNIQPYLAVNFIIALQGTFPSRNSSEPFLAEIIMFGGNFNPRGWALCNGQLLPIAQNSALFSLLGTTFGGDGRTNFALPDLRGRVPIHAGQGPGLSNYRLGQKGGAETTGR